MLRDRDGEGWMRVGLDRETSEGRAEPWTVYMVHGRKRVHGDEDGVGQVDEDDGESSRRSVWRVRANDSKASRLCGRSDTRRHWWFDRFDLKIGGGSVSAIGTGVPVIPDKKEENPSKTRRRPSSGSGPNPLPLPLVGPGGQGEWRVNGSIETKGLPVGFYLGSGTVNAPHLVIAPSHKNIMITKDVGIEIRGKR